MTHSSQDLHQKLQQTLLQCTPLADQKALTALFSVPPLDKWQHLVPYADHTLERVEKLIATLTNKTHPSDPCPALALLCQVLRDRLHPAEALYHKLDHLAKQLQHKQPPPTPNPFFVGGRVTPNHFFGRDKILREIKDLLASWQNSAIIGNSQIGKTSLLYYLYATRDQWLPSNVTVHFLDLQGVLDAEDFCERMLEKMGQTGSTPRELNRALRQTSNHIFLLDEVEQLATKDFDVRFQNILRAKAQEQGFAFCVSARNNLQTLFQQENLSPFYNVFNQKQLDPFTHQEAHAFLQKRLHQSGIVFSDSDIAQLINDSGCHPAHLQRMAHALFAQYQHE